MLRSNNEAKMSLVKNKFLSKCWWTLSWMLSSLSTSLIVRIYHRNFFRWLFHVRVCFRSEYRLCGQTPMSSTMHIRELDYMLDRANLSGGHTNTSININLFLPELHIAHKNNGPMLMEIGKKNADQKYTNCKTP